MSNLPKLNWSIITPSRPTSTAGTDILVTLKTQFQLTKYWQLVESAFTGTSSIVVKPNALYSTSSNCNVVIATNITGSTAFRSPDNNTSTSTRLQMGIAPNVAENGSGSFKGPNADRPFDSITGTPRWSGYWTLANAATISASFIVESEDSIFVGFKESASTSGTMGGLAGCIVESYDSGSGENNYRLYGMATGGATSFGSTFWSATTAGVSTFLAHSITAHAAHFGLFAVSGGIVANDTAFSYCTRMPAMTINPNSMNNWNSTTVAGSRQIATPIMIIACEVPQTNPLKLAGNLRGIYMGSDEQGIVRVQSGGIDQVFKISTRHNAAGGNTIVFGPASGSGL